MENNLGLVVENERVVVSSVVVAEAFHKNNKDVLRSIDSVKVMEDFFNDNFFRSTYVGSNNREYPDYKMTRNGFMLVVMGFTGKEALQVKIMFIKAFDAMEAELKQIHQGKGTFIPNFDNPVEACEHWLEERKANIALTKQLELAAPKIQFADAISSSETDIYVNDLAKILKQNGIETGEVRFYKWLRENKYVTKAGYNRNLPTQRSMELGLFKINENTYEYVKNGKNQGKRISKTTMVTPKGQQYFIDLFLNKNGAARQLTMDYEAEEVKHAVKEKEPFDGKDFTGSVSNWHRLEKYLNMPIPNNWYKLSIEDRVSYVNKNVDKDPNELVGAPRNFVSNTEIWVECFGGELHGSIAASRTIGKMIACFKEWDKKLDNEHRKYQKQYGQQYVYLRNKK